MLYIELCEVELELLADRHVNIGTFDPITPKLQLSLYYERRSKATYL